MKPTEEILSLLENRRKAGEELGGYDLQVREWCDRNGVRVDDIERLNSCMLVSEPIVYEGLFLQRIEETD